VRKQAVCQITVAPARDLSESGLEQKFDWSDHNLIQ
jgi:hypothetical protein